MFPRTRCKSCNIHFSMNLGKRSSKEVRESDNVLRQSLEAISAADRYVCECV